MATNICLNPPLQSNEVARQGLTDMYLPTLKLREARSPTYWAITESNHQSNINLLSKPSPREYNPKAVDYNSPYSSASYIARPAASSVINIIPSTQQYNDQRPQRMSSAGDIPNISVNAADSYRGADSRVEAPNCTQICCGGNRDYDSRAYAPEAPQRELTDQEGIIMHWPVLEIEDGREVTQGNRAGSICCPGMFGEGKSSNNGQNYPASTSNMWQPDEDTISYARPTHDHTRSENDRRRDKQEQSTADYSKPPYNNNKPSRQEANSNNTGAEPVSSLDILSSRASEMDFYARQAAETVEPQISNNQNFPGRPSQIIDQPNSSPPSRVPTTSPQIQPPPARKIDQAAQEGQDTQKSYSKQQSRNSQNWNPQQQPRSSQPWNSQQWDSRENRKPIADSISDANRSEQKQYIEEGNQDTCGSIICGGEPKKIDETGTTWMYPLQEYTSPKGVVEPPQLGPAIGRGGGGICGPCEVETQTTEWEDPKLIREGRYVDPASAGAGAGGGAGTDGREIHENGRSKEILEVDTANVIQARACCEADFIQTEGRSRRISEPTNRIIQAVSPRGLCAPDPAQVRRILHIEHYDVAQ